MSEENLLAAIPDGDLLNWVIGWRDRDGSERGTAYVSACNSEEAKRGYETDNPTREVTNIYQSIV